MLNIKYNPLCNLHFWVEKSCHFEFLHYLNKLVTKILFVDKIRKCIKLLWEITHVRK